MRKSIAFTAACLVLLPLLATKAGAAPGWAKGHVGFRLEPLVILSASQRAELGVTGDHGVVVATITEGGPAEKAGLKAGDHVLRFGGEDVPDLLTDTEEPRHLWHVAVRYLIENVPAGIPIEMVVERDGTTKTITVTPIPEAEFHRLQADEALHGTLPSLAQAGPPQPLSIGFEGVAEGALLPDGFFPYEGRWRVVMEPGSKGNAVLRQDKTVLPWAVLLVAGKGRAFADGKASVRFMPQKGIQDASGGIVFRAQDPKNYYVVRPNALENNFRIYIVKDGIRTELGSATVTPPSENAWHVFDVTFVGPKFRATLDGKDVVEATDDTFASGWCGLWTKADSVTLFDDLKVTPGEAR
jgi:hypothetical protein